MKKTGYIVIGGQYEPVCRGYSKTLLGAKQKATTRIEEWDDPMILSVPKIYRAQDCHLVETKRNGVQPAPNPGAGYWEGTLYPIRSWEPSAKRCAWTEVLPCHV